MESLSSSLHFMSNTVDESNKMMTELKRDYTVIKKANEQLHLATRNLEDAVGELQDKV